MTSSACTTPRPKTKIILANNAAHPSRRVMVLLPFLMPSRRCKTHLGVNSYSSIGLEASRIGALMLLVSDVLVDGKWHFSLSRGLSLMVTKRREYALLAPQ